ncbi:MAG: PQQ-binding-like beta-propeller repeat protein [bacterium]|nr:PQQ-binding-like beta-propeller repeat protein [bacterium]MDD5756392.1 PQQ-binding-like beta-propeller repeat protein [bacterium]
MYLKNKRGAILIMAIGIVLFVLLLGLLFINILTTDVRMAAGSENTTIALYIAEAGLSWSLPQLDYDSSWRTGATMSFNGGSFTVTLEDGDGGTVQLKSVGTYKGVQKTLRVRILMGNWPMFKYCPERTGYSFPQHIVARELDEKWYYTAGGDINSSPAVDKSRVVFGCDDNKVYCIRASDGGFIWSYTTGNDVLSSPCIYKNYVYVGSLDGYFYCLNLTTGALVWRYRNPAVLRPWRASPCAVDDVIYTACDDGRVYAFDYETGNIKVGWPFLISNNVAIYSSPAIDTAAGVLYIGADNSYFYAINLVTASLVPGWPEDMDGAVRSTACVSESGYWYWHGQPYGGGTFIYQCSMGGTVVSFDPSGWWHWIARRSYGDIQSSPVYSPEEDSIFVGSGTRRLYQFRCRDGRQVDSYNTSHAVDSTPAVQNDQLFVGNDDNYVVALNISNLSRRYRYNTQGNVDSSPAIYGNNLYIGSDSNRLYKFASQVTPTGTMTVLTESWRDTF